MQEQETKKQGTLRFNSSEGSTMSSQLMRHNKIVIYVVAVAASNHQTSQVYIRWLTQRLALHARNATSSVCTERCTVRHSSP